MLLEDLLLGVACICWLAQLEHAYIPSLPAARLSGEACVCQLVQLECAYSQSIGCNTCRGGTYMSAATIGVFIYSQSGCLKLMASRGHKAGNEFRL